MLELKGIYKDYQAGSGTVHALKGIDLQFRESEFVSILGPSGCGKTTLLNIIGGLDQYTEGDLVINGKSTKNFVDRDWDSYRNHSVGFVFQTYNLIPHQTVLQNVEIALTLSGVSKKIRRQKAIAALESVGLGDQLNKRPSQMSGGQMQRVAIARALVNDPDIILADEPTGALDSETSVQVMEILKGVAKDRLVVMVTHNPDLAEQYSTRIIRMLDGKMQSDSMPLNEEEIAALQQAQQEKAVQKKPEKKPTMKWTTSFGLSLKNLIAKRGRTTLTSFAGSIGIIGIALIYAVSQGTRNYINTAQEDALSSYPMTLQATTIDLNSLMQSLTNTAESKKPHDKDAVYSKDVFADIANVMSGTKATQNDLRSFKAFLEAKLADPDSDFSDAVNGIHYSYALNLPIYTKNVDGTLIESNAQTLFQELMLEQMGSDISSMSQMGQTSSSSSSSLASMMTSSSTSTNIVWQELLPGKDGSAVNGLLYEQYDLIHGSWPTAHNEVVLVVDENNEMSDLALYTLGLISKEDMSKVMAALKDGQAVDNTSKKWKYEDICSREYCVILPGDCYILDEATGLYKDVRIGKNDTAMRYLYDNGLKLKVTGIIRPNEDSISQMLTGSICYTSDLTKYVIEKCADAAVVKAQLASPDVDVLTGLPFRAEEGALTNEQKQEAFLKRVAELSLEEKAALYTAIMSIPSDEIVAAQVQQQMAGMTAQIVRAMLMQMLPGQSGMDQATIETWLGAMSDEDVLAFCAEMIAEQVRTEYANMIKGQHAAISSADLAAALELALPTYTADNCAFYYDNILEFSESAYKTNLTAFGNLDLDDPAAINIYPTSFDNKDRISALIDEYNAGVDETKKITYTDYLKIMMSAITLILDAITYVLIAFVSISLVVSSIMIGVITLISVQERTKEIGILRAIGASKRNVSNMFNAETVMIGAASGLVGVGVTYLLCIPINLIVQHLTKIPTLRAQLPISVAIFLVLISIALSVFAGFIPSRSAAKKDPVVALRTE